MRTALLCLAATLAWAQSDPQIYKVGGDVRSPTLRRKIEPQYPDVARQMFVNGKVVLAGVMDEQGHATNLHVIVPVGYGLDEEALRAVGLWEFGPASRKGKPVKVYFTVEVTFILDHREDALRFMAVRERYNDAIAKMNEPSAAGLKALATLKQLADEKYSPALFAYGRLLEDGKAVTQDAEQGRSLIQQAADAKLGAALFYIGARQMSAAQTPEQQSQAMGTIESAANYGSQNAQLFVGNAYETGTSVARDPDRALLSFWLCANNRDARCQVRGARILLNRPEKEEEDLVQALAWLTLAGEQGSDEAKALLTEQALTTDQAKKVRARVATLKQNP